MWLLLFKILIKTEKRNKLDFVIFYFFFLFTNMHKLMSLDYSGCNTSVSDFYSMDTKYSNLLQLLRFSSS